MRRSNAVRWSAVRLVTVRLSAVRLVTVRLVTVRLGAVRLSTVTLAVVSGNSGGTVVEVSFVLSVVMAVLGMRVTKVAATAWLGVARSLRGLLVGGLTIRVMAVAS